MSEPISRLALFVAAIRSFAAATLSISCILVLGPPILLWVLISRRPVLLYRVSALVVRMALAIAGVRYRVEGGEHIDPHRPCVYAVNHVSNIDPPVLT